MLNKYLKSVYRVVIFIVFMHFGFVASARDFPKDRLSVSTVLQSHMVIQQNKPFKVWGKAPQGTLITIKADWMASPIQVRATAEKCFEGIISVPKAKRGDYRPHSISISGMGQQVVLNDLLIGDLWFLSGQSNMQFAVGEMLDSTRVIAEADHPHIRLLNVALNFSAQPVDSIKGNWAACTPSTVRTFSAVGYSFGAELQKKLDIPIGLIFSGIGASAVQAFVPEEVLKKDSLLNRVYLQPIYRIQNQGNLSMPLFLLKKLLVLFCYITL